MATKDSMHTTRNDHADCTDDPAAHPDLITNAPGSHPTGSGVGAATGGIAGVGAAIAAGAAAGTVIGPIGTVVGAVVGGVAGGLIGKSIAEGINPTVEHNYWRGHYSSRPYVAPGLSYDEYGPAYEHGFTARGEYPGKDFDAVEDQLALKWETTRGKSKLNWDKAKPASRDAWDRVSNESDIDRM